MTIIWQKSDPITKEFFFQLGSNDTSWNYELAHNVDGSIIDELWGLMKRLLLPTLLLLFPMLLLAQVAPRVAVRLQQPPPNQLRVSDMWKITLTNSGRTTVRIYLQGIATEVRDGQIVDAQTAPFDVPPGTKRLTGRDVEPVKVNSSNSRYKNVLMQTGLVPSGDYTICVYAKEVTSNDVVGSDCFNQEIQNVSLVLMTPDNNTSVGDELPIFNWTTAPLITNGATYSIKIVEMFGSQSPTSAMESNPAYFRQENISTRNFNYPVSASKFKSGGQYAWQVTLFNDGVKVAESEVWSFLYVKSPNFPPPPPTLTAAFSRFMKAYGGGSFDQLYAVASTNDSGYILAGKTRSFGAGGDDAYVVKVDKSGNVQWSRAFGGSNDDAAFGVAQAHNGGYIAVGYTRSFDAMFDDIYVVKMDAQGNVQWSRTYGGGGHDAGYSIIPTANNSYTIAGVLGTGDSYDGYLLRIEANGALVWSRSFGGDDYDILKSVTEHGEALYATGWTRSFGNGNDDMMVAKVNPNGTVMWVKSWGTNRAERGAGIASGPSGFATAGYTLGKLGETTQFNVLAIGFANDGNDQGKVVVRAGLYNEAFSIAADKKGAFYLTGYAKGTDLANVGGILMMKLSGNGALEWAKVYQSTAVSEGRGIVTARDGGLVVAGFTEAIGAGDGLLLKTDGLGVANCAELDPKAVADMTGLTAKDLTIFGVGSVVVPRTSVATTATTIETLLCPK